MKSYPSLILAAGVCALGCTPDTGQSDEAYLEESAAVGAVRGTARDASTDEPLGGVHVWAGELGAVSDEAGSYGLAPLQPGSVTLRAYLRSFAPESVTVVIEPGVSAVIDFPLRPSSGPCCDLTGVWSATVVLDSAGLNATPSSREAAGEIVFDALSADSDQPGVYRVDGTSRVDFASLLGPQVGAEDSARGLVFGGDSVAITVVPRFADWGVELLGRVGGDTIQGIWFQRASCCGAYGTFTLLRTAGAE